jgi:predicted GNAT family N-acyltransferase
MSNRIQVRVAQSAEDREMAFMIRSAVFIGEQKCPYFEEFDGNDYSATHLLGFVDDEPAATARLRYFSDCLKFERFAVRSEFRGTEITRCLIDFAFDFSQKKGYTKLYGHAQKRLLRFWRRYGFQPVDKAPFHFSDAEYVAMVADIAPSDTALGSASDDRVLLRPEGVWDRPGILERSMMRPAREVLRDRPGRLTA